MGKFQRRKERPSRSTWRITRRRIWERDQGKCQGPYCTDTLPYSLPLLVAHIDHVRELSRGGSNRDRNLRVLCRRCHVLRASQPHHGMIAKALRDEIIPPEWRSLV
ncbi:HNH endonuclease [Microcoleus sp. FACHB-1515]|uniref:HNH endonuclease n=1 Tax=Cyanophyceae TaxID=3028117 RepID=UPI00168963EE|nr:HNH endonuclease signature motif containing protein [Microcoleus sp. FACHB-1515]MBD2093454.1 HNH endonuclease [Microcoleus sp. FACHB-1515]